MAVCQAALMRAVPPLSGGAQLVFARAQACVLGYIRPTAASAKVFSGLRLGFEYVVGEVICNNTMLNKLPNPVR